MSGEEHIALRQQRDLGEFIQDALALYSQRFWLFFAISAVVIPFGILTSIVSNEITLTFEGFYEEAGAADEALRDLAVIVPLSLMQFLALWLASLAIIAALAGLEAEEVSKVSHTGRQQGVTFSHAYGMALARFWTLLGASLRVAVVLLPPFAAVVGGAVAIGLANGDAGTAVLSLGMIPSFLWAIYHAIRWLFIHQAVIFDRTSAKAALSYSAHAVEGRWWRALGIVLLMGLVVLVPSRMVGAFFGLAPVYVSSVVTALMTAALLPLGVIAMTLLYFDLKLRKESDVVLSPA